MKLLAAIALASAAPTPDADIERYYSMLSAVQSDEIALPIAKCAHSKIRAHTPSPEEVGQMKKAAELLNTSMEACGWRSGQDKITASLKAKYPEASPAEIERAGQYAFAIPFGLLLGEATDQMKVPPPAGADRRLVEIPLPCPEDLNAKPGHPCFEKPKN